MSIWSVDYELEDRTREVGEIIHNNNEVRDPFIENNSKNIDTDFSIKSKEINKNTNPKNIDFLLRKGTKFKDYLLSLNLVLQIII